MRTRLLLGVIIGFILFSQGSLFVWGAEGGGRNRAIQDELKKAESVRPKMPTMKKLFVEPLLPVWDWLRRRPVRLQPLSEPDKGLSPQMPSIPSLPDLKLAPAKAPVVPKPALAKPETLLKPAEPVIIRPPVAPLPAREEIPKVQLPVLPEVVDTPKLEALPAEFTPLSGEKPIQDDKN